MYEGVTPRAASVDQTEQSSVDRKGLPTRPDDCQPRNGKTGPVVEAGSQTIETLQRNRQEIRCSPARGRVIPTSCELCSLIVDKSALLTPDPPIEEIDEPESPYDVDISDVRGSSESRCHDVGNELPSQEQMFGPESLRTSIAELCHQYRDIFSSSVKEEPARVRPFEIHIEGSEWKIPASRRAPRPQSPEKSRALKQMIEDLLRLGVIRVSQAEHASQVLLVVKKNTTKLRFCVDYRELNDISKTDSWPIPNILELLSVPSGLGSIQRYRRL